MAVFYLIRHGEKVEVIGDAALSLVGGVQARSTAQYLQDRSISSPSQDSPAFTPLEE